jgi:hypothetical protein
MTVRVAKVDTVILQDPKISHFQFDGSSPERGRLFTRRLCSCAVLGDPAARCAARARQSAGDGSDACP